MYLLDTNIVINYLDASMPMPAMQFMDNIVNLQCSISVITKMEALGYSFKTPAEEKVMWTFVNGCEILKIGDVIVNDTIAIRKAKRMKLPDAIIAATAVVHGLILLTRNTTDFNGIAGLQIINPWDV